MDYQNLLIDLALKGGPYGLFLFGIVLLAAYKFRSKVGSGFSGANQDDPESPVQKVDRRLSKVEASITDLQMEMSKRPTQQDLHDVQIGMTRMEERIGAIHQSQVRVESQLGRLEQFFFDYDMRGRD